MTTPPEPSSDKPAGTGPENGQNDQRRRGLIGPFTARHIGLANAVVIGAAAVLFAFTRPIGAPTATPPVQPGATFYVISAETKGLAVGQLAPELTGRDGDAEIGLTDLDGQPISLAAYRGKPVWVVFWATWCPPCQQETPDIRDAYDAHEKDGLVVIAIDIQEDVDSVRQYVETYGLRYRIGMDTTAAIMRTYSVFGLPTHYFIDRHGVIRDRYFGPLKRAEMEQRISVISEP